METLNFLTDEQVRSVQERFGTPVFVYDRQTLEARAREALAFPNAYGLTVRYAMKASPNAEILRTFHHLGLQIDASSGFEAERAMIAGIPPSHIQITAQQIPGNLAELVKRGVKFNACSLHQLRVYGTLFPGTQVSIRVNPGKGSGHSERTNTGGPSAGFGIWHGHLEEVMAAAREFGLTITMMHTHIGSGSDPDMWDHCARLALGIAARLPDVTTLSLGGGYKVGRMAHEKSTDLRRVGAPIREEFEAFAAEHGRQLHLEIEPGTYLVANAGALVATIIDVVDTGKEGFNFIKVDSGMTEVLRPSIYGAQHPLVVVPGAKGERGMARYIVTGHCCESGDILTPEPDDPEGLKPRELAEAHIGDALVVEGAGAYCASMSPKNYNSFPEAPEVMLEPDGSFRLIRRRQTLEQMLSNEL